MQKLFLLFLLLAFSPLTHAANSVAVSLSNNGILGNGNSSNVTISADGRYAVFQSDANDLVAGDSNANRDIFLRDLETNITELISVTNDGTGSGNGASSEPVVSSDGRFVVFQSASSNLVTTDNNANSDIFLRDRQNNTTTLISMNSAGSDSGNFGSSNPAVTPDGRFVAFASQASDLVVGDSNINFDIFLRDRQNNTTTLISMNSAATGPGNSNSFNPALSADGRFIAFQSAASNLVVGDNNSATDIFLRDRQNNTNTLISMNSANSAAAMGNSFNPVISSDGRYVAFDSAASDLVSGDTNAVSDVFLRDTQTAITSLISTPLTSNGDSTRPSISADGRYIAFQSDSTNLTINDQNGTTDVFLHDTQVGSIRLLSLINSNCEGADADSAIPALSTDGRFVAFDSFATNLVVGDVNESRDIFIQNLLSVSGPLNTATLPASRSVQVAQTATSFATLINTSACEVAINCSISPSTSVPASFAYQTTDITNNLVGTINTPINIPIGGTQNFVFAFTPSAAIAPTDVSFTYQCENSDAALTTVGLNTILLSADVNPIPDIIALTTVVDLLTVVQNFALFAVGSSNVGVTGSITASVDDGGRGLPLDMTLCQTDALGACISPASPTVTLNYAGAGTASFAVFVNTTAAIPNDPANNRIFIRFTDSNGIVRGATSTAVRTQ